jgi:hypothetical protein
MSSSTSLSSEVKSEIAVSSAGDDGSKRKQEPNFKEWEDLTLGKCYIMINTSCDTTTVGNNQKGMVFWRKVHEKFSLVHSQMHISIKQQHEQVRSFDQELMNRFNRNIKVNIMV